MDDGERQAWGRITRGEQEPTWDLLAEPIARSNNLTSAGKEVASWAIARLGEFFGDRWLVRSFRDGSPLMDLLWTTLNDAPHTHLRRIELAAQLALLETRAARWPSLRKGARNQTAAWGPTLLQLEVGALALAHGFEIEFEPPLSSGNLGDVLLTGPSTMLIEATTIHPPADEAAMARFWDKVGLRLADLRARHDVSVSGFINEVVPDEVLDSWITEIEPIAASVFASGGQRAAPSPGGGLIFLTHGPAQESATLHGPTVDIDEWGRLSTRIDQKARQGESDRPLWIRIDDGPWLWTMSFPASAPRNQVHATLAERIQEVIRPFPHVAGVIVTSPPLTFSYPPRLNEEWSLRGGAIGLLRSLRQGCGREAVLVPGRHEDAISQLAEWHRWYAEEAGWLDWALEKLDRPPADQLVRQV